MELTKLELELYNKYFRKETITRTFFKYFTLDYTINTFERKL